MLLILIIVIIGLPLLLIIREMNENQADLIEKNGIETTGTVIQKAIGADDSGRQYSVKFDFYAGDTLNIGYLGLKDNKYYYEKAIIGMKYRVKYLKDNPQDFKNSIIYLNSPILHEFQNIETERIRIRNEYENGEKFLKDARPIEEERKILGL